MGTRREINTRTRIVYDCIVVNEGIGTVMNLDTLFSTLNSVVGYWWWSWIDDQYNWFRRVTINGIGCDQSIISNNMNRIFLIVHNIVLLNCGSGSQYMDSILLIVFDGVID